MNETQIAVFLDRDGTLIHETNYLKDVKDLQLFDQTPSAIRELNDSNILAIMISNQSGVARGYFDEENVQHINNAMNERLKAHNAHLDGFYYCPHHPKGCIEEYTKECNCRKPSTGMIELALKDFPEINLPKSYVIGDKQCDIELAKKSGCKGVLVRTGHGKYLKFESCRPHFIANDLKEGIKWILKDIETQAIQLQESNE